MRRLKLKLEMNAMKIAPLGTILPWVPKPDKDSNKEVSVPKVPASSINAGQRTPDLN